MVFADFKSFMIVAGIGSSFFRNSVMISSRTFQTAKYPMACYPLSVPNLIGVGTLKDYRV
jgi:hypothetical protein